MPIAWRIKEFLDDHDLTPYRLVQASGIPQGTVYRLVNGDTRNLNADTLALTLDALRVLTGEPVGLDDVLEYTPAESAAPPRLTAAGVPYTGDPETDWWLDHEPDVLERIRKLEAGDAKFIPIEDVAAELGLKLER